MADIENLTEVRILKETDRQKISVVEDADGNRYLRRDILDEKREIYKALANVGHCGVPKIFGVSLTDRTTVLEEYIDGITLAEFSENNRLSRRKIRKLAIKLISAVVSVHKEGIIHRDIKPQNVLVDKRGNVYLVDYDISRIERNELKKDTDTLGTFGYAPIEQYGMMPTDKRTDIYSFGMTLKTLLDRFGIKGNLLRIAQKCTRLDPNQRYSSASAVKRALKIDGLKYLFIAVLLVCFLGIGLIEYKPLIQTVQNTQIETSPEPIVTDVSDGTQVEEIIPKEEKPIETPDEPTGEEKWRKFRDFEKGETEKEYFELQNNGAICTFATDTPYEHLVFAEDIQKSGTILFGKNETPVKADISLDDGVLNVSLDDGKGNNFNHSFKYEDNHQYTDYNSDNMRKNADLMRYDFDNDGYNELLVGINESAVSVRGTYLDSFFNYSVGWCIRYDEQNGFTLCQGDMFSPNSFFSIYSYNDGVVSAHWITADDPVGYCLKDNMLIPLS